MQLPSLDRSPHQWLSIPVVLAPVPAPSGRAVLDKQAVRDSGNQPGGQYAGLRGDCQHRATTSSSSPGDVVSMTDAEVHG
jgi:hypothetical protein